MDWEIERCVVGMSYEVVCLSLQPLLVDSRGDIASVSVEWAGCVQFCVQGPQPRAGSGPSS